MKLQKDIIVAIDGPASSGKSSLAKKLAEELKYTYIDTGAMYRAVTLWALENGCFEGNNLNTSKIIENLNNIELKFVYNLETCKSEIHLNNQNVEKTIRTPLVADKVSIVAAVPQIRSFLVQQQQKMGKNKQIVMDGRDIATVVFPNAEIKFFVTASPEVRAKRRYLELISKGETITYEQVLQNVLQRDHIDTTRETEPLRKSEDAILIDNSNIDEYETFIIAASIIANRFGYGIQFS